MTEEKTVRVRSLVNHKVVFKDEDTHRRIVFNPYEIKVLPVDMLRRLNYSHGGAVLLRNYLSVEDDELAREFGVPEDMVEYKWTREDVDKCLQSGSIDELLDALDFGPEGIKETIVSRAIELKINDVSKREAITNKTGRNIDSIINLKEQYDKAMETPEETNAETASRRRVNHNSNTTSGRRVRH